MSDEEWINLVQKLGPKLYRFFLSQNSKSYAEDAVQEVFLRLLDRINRSGYSRELQNTEAFAWGIAVNVRKEIKRKLRSVEALAEEDDDSGDHSIYVSGVSYCHREDDPIWKRQI